MTQPSDRARKAAQCTIPPEGWYCTRPPGHDGPCAAKPTIGKLEEWFVDAPDDPAFERETPGFAAGVEADYRCDYCGRQQEDRGKEPRSTHCAPPFKVQRHSYTGTHPADATIHNLAPAPPAAKDQDDGR